MPAEAEAAPAPPPAAVCPPLDEALIAPFALDTRILGVRPPAIVDPQRTLAHLHRRLAELARGTAKDHVRIAVYGDSNMTMDFITGQMRRTLAARYGDAGHGYVAFSRPWPWYTHQDVRHDVDVGAWRQIATSTHRIGDGQYGFANLASESSRPGATAWVRTAPESSPIGKTVSRFDLYYLKGPRRGSFHVKLDGKLHRTIDTAATETSAGFEAIDVEDGPHKLEVIAAGNGRVRLFGAALERRPAEHRFGVTVDSLGVGALNFEQMQHVGSGVRVQMLARRKYDLVVFLLGTNMFSPAHHNEWVENTLRDYRAALPETPILILSPPDILLDVADTHSDPRIVKLARQLKDIAARQGAAFWDFRQAMGGDAAIKRFRKLGLAAPDCIHLTHSGGSVMGNRLLHALFQDLQSWLAEHPDAGCPAPRGS